MEKTQVAKTTKTDKILNAFENGKTLTAGQIREKFNVANPSASISYIRNRLGFYVVTSEKRGKTYYGFQAAA